MSGPIIRLEIPQNDTTTLACTLERPPAPAGQSAMALVQCTPDNQTFVDLDAGKPKTPTAAGDLLWTALRENKHVQTALDAMLLDAAGSPLYVRVASGTTERFPWEVLRAPSGFLALDQWPIARLTNDAAIGDAPFAYDPPLRMLVVLAAATIKAKGEWDAIREAVDSSPVPVDQQVLVAEKDLLEEIGAAIGQDKVAYTQDRRFLESKAREFRPHLLHLFCHGRAPQAGGVPSIDIATFQSWDGQAGDSIILEPKDLAAWLGSCITTMCSCEGGAAAAGANSFAYVLAGRGIPAVFAMRQPIASTDAHAFTRAHYRSLFAAVGLAIGGEPLDLAAATIEARGALCDNYGNDRRAIAAVHPQWSLPVLYLRAERLQFEVARGAETAPLPSLSDTDIVRLRARLDTLRVGRRDLPADTPPDILQKLDDEIAAVSAELYGEVPA